MLQGDLNKNAKFLYKNGYKARSPKNLKWHYIKKLMSPGVLFMWKISYLYQKQHRVGTMLLYMKKAGRKYPDRLADSCKRLSVNQMAAGSRMSWCIMDFFSCLQLF